LLHLPFGSIYVFFCTMILHYWNISFWRAHQTLEEHKGTRLYWCLQVEGYFLKWLLNSMAFLMRKNSLFTKIFAEMWITIIGKKFGPFSLKRTLHAIACNGHLFKFWSTCFDRHMHYAFLHVCLYIVECSLFTIHCSMQPLNFYGSGMWSRALGFQGPL
jgi:hypothetical protein